MVATVSTAPTDARPAGASALRDRFILVLTAATVISFIDRYLPAILVDEVRREIALSDIQFSTLQTGFALVYAFATLGSGWLADRVNRMRLLVVGTTLWTVGTLIFGLAGNLPHLIGGRMLIGLGEAVLGPAGVSLLCDRLAPEGRGKAIALTYFGATLGTSLTFSGGGWLLGVAHAGALDPWPLIGDLSPWQQVTLLLAATSAVFIPAFLSFPEPAREERAITNDTGRLADFWIRRALLWPIFGLGLSVAVADFAYTSWQTALLTRTYGFGAAAAGQYLGFSALVAGTAGAWLGGIAVDRAHRRGGEAGRVRVIAWCGGGLLAATAILLIPGAGAAIVAFAAWQVVANVAYVACAVTLLELSTARTRALASAISVAMSIGIGLGFGPTLIAALNQSLGHGRDALVPSTIIVLGALGLVTLVLSRLLIARLKDRAFNQIADIENA